MLGSIQISETREALLLILERIHTLALLGRDISLAPSEDSESNLYHLMNSFSLNGKDYKIHRGVFSEIVHSLQKKKIIQIQSMDDQDVASYFHDPSMVYEFVADFVREDPTVNVKELLKDCVLIFKLIDPDKLKEELKRQGAQASIPVGNNLRFNEREKILWIGNRKVVISQSRPNRSFLLLRTIFQDISKEWSFDEIEEDWDPEAPVKKVNQNKFYQACRTTNQKIALESGIKEFLKYSKTSVRINPKYLV